MRFHGSSLSDCFIDQSFHDDPLKKSSGPLFAGAALNAPRPRWFDFLKYPMLSVVLQFILGWSYNFPDGSDGGRPACRKDEFEVAQNSGMCGLEETLRLGHLKLRFLTAIVLGGYVVSTVSLWRTRRTNYCSLCGAVRNLLIQISTLVPDSDTKICMERWVILGYELAILKARGKMDSSEGRQYLESLGVLAGGGKEWDNMVEGDRHTTVWYWIQRESVSLTDEGVIRSEARLKTICEAISEIRGKANDLMSCIDRDHSIAYSSLVGITVSFSVITMILWKGIQWAIWFYDTRGMIWTEPRMYAELIILIIFYTIFNLLFDTDQVLYNPFGPRELDVPHDIVGVGLRRLATRLGESKMCFPYERSGGVKGIGGVEGSGGDSSEKHVVEMEIKYENIEYERDEVFGANKKRVALGVGRALTRLASAHAVRDSCTSTLTPVRGSQESHPPGMGTYGTRMHDSGVDPARNFWARVPAAVANVFHSCDSQQTCRRTTDVEPV